MAGGGAEVEVHLVPKATVTPAPIVLPLLALWHSSFSERDVYRGPPTSCERLFPVRSVVDRITAFLPRMLQMKLCVDRVMPIDLSNVSS